MRGIPMLLVSAAGAALAASAVPALAQDVATAPQGDAPAATEGSEIVVTAQHRSERLIEVPLAVTAVTGDALASQQINDAQALTRAIPSLSYQQGGAPNNSAFRIRGVGTSLFGQGVEPSVSVVVDGVVTPRAGSGFTNLVDIQRVEVLRGPQGTLFGKNSTAGVINITTAAPSHTLEGKAEATVAEHDEYRLKGSVSGPLGDQLGLRLTGYYNNVGGQYYNVASKSNYGKSESWGVRGKLQWDPSSALKVTLIGDYNRSNQECCTSAFVRVETPVILQLISPITPTFGSNLIADDNLSYVRTKLATVSLQADWDLGPATVTSITAYQRYNETNQAEADGIRSIPTIYIGNTPGTTNPAAYVGWDYQPAHQKQDYYSQELRLASNGTRDLTYVLGVYLSDLELHRDLDRRRTRCTSGTIGQPCATASTVWQSSGFNAEFSSKAASVFGQVDWRVAGGLHVVLGAREQYEKQRVVGSTYAPLPGHVGDVAWPGIANTSGTSNRDGWGFSGRAGLRYEFDRNLQAYATYTRGYKAFALDLGAATNFGNNPGLDPERVNAYELGVKARTLDGALDLNLAVFRSDYSNLQLQTTIVDPITGLGVAKQINAGKSRTEGVEVEATLRPTRNFSIATSFSYVKATIDVDGLNCPLGARTGIPTIGAGGTYPINSCYFVPTSPPTALINIRGGQLPSAPKYRWTVAPQFETEVGSNLTLFLQGSANYTSSYLFDTNQDQALKQPGYIMVDASVGIGTSDGKYRVTAFVRNLFNEHYYTALGHAGLLSSTVYPNDLSGQIAKDSNRYGGVTFNAKF